MNSPRIPGAFPWTLDQYQRYAVLKAFLETYYSGPGLSVLDIGGLSPDREGRSWWLPLMEIHGGKGCVLDRLFFRGDGFVQGDGLHLPFKDGAFDVTSALDVVEHIDAGRRKPFIRELCRTARRAVVVSAPFAGGSVEAVEDALQDEIRSLSGQTHRQLQEHRDKRLPDVSEVTGSLRELMPAGLDFSFGSLGNWCALQAVENVFLGRRRSGRIHSILDGWMASVLPASGSEFRPPFSRHYWLFSRDRTQDELEEGRGELTGKLADGPRAGDIFSGCASLPGEIKEFFCGDRISAIVVAGTGRNLKECLNHLLSQDVPVDLAVTVWNPGRAAEVEAVLREDFPSVRRYEARPGARADNALLAFSDSQSENLRLLLSEDILLPRAAVRDLYERWKRGPAADLLVPRIIGKSRSYGVWKGAKYSPLRILAGRAPNPLWRMHARIPAWVHGECLFFHRRVLGAKKLGGRALRKRNLFLWEKAVRECAWTYVPEITVYKKLRA